MSIYEIVKAQFTCILSMKICICTDILLVMVNQGSNTINCIVAAFMNIFFFIPNLLALPFLDASLSTGGNGI